MTAATISEQDRDSLADRLRWVRICKRTEKELGYDFDDAPIKKKSSFKKQGNRPEQLLHYFNTYLCLHLDNYGPEIWFEHAASNVLFDLAHIPFQMVHDRLRQEYIFYNTCEK